MFRPQCSNDIVSERARFCTRCSFPLANVKEFVETEVAKSKAEEEKKKYPLRQPDSTLSANVLDNGWHVNIQALWEFPEIPQDVVVLERG